VVFQLPEEIVFPKPELADPDGLLAIGGDLSPQRLLTAYSIGIFPWSSEGEPILWWSLPQRLILFPDKAKFSKSLLQRIKKQEFEIRVDTNFQKVIENCASVNRKNQKRGTWITSDMIDAYIHLHELGFAHSFETYKNNELVGGLYGLSLGKMFAGESMFYLQRDASKVAYYYLLQFALRHQFHFIDCQQVTSHMKSFGASVVKRRTFQKLLEKSLMFQTMIGKWEL